MSKTKPKLNPNSALYWLPAAREVTTEYDVAVPETEVVEFDFMQTIPMLDGEQPADFPWGELDDALCSLGWPAFVRTDLSSAKHDGLDGVRARDADDAGRLLELLVSDAARKMMQPGALLVREWIDIESEFSAFGGLPIGVEFRVFATPDDHLETHYYWPEDSIENPSLPESLWTSARDQLAHARRPPWLGAAARMAAFEADFMHGIDEPDRAWSVDFARDEDGQWWLIDMALAEDSWHPDGGLDSDE